MARCEKCGCTPTSNCVCPQVIAYIPGVEEYVEELQVPWEHAKLFKEPTNEEDTDEGTSTAV